MKLRFAIASLPLLSIAQILPGTCPAEMVGQDGLTADRLPPPVTSAAVEYGAVEDPVTRELYFVRTDAPWGSPGCGKIMKAIPKGLGWKEAQPVFADGCFGDPAFSVDGSQIFFTAPSNGDGSKAKNDDIWVADREGDDWTNRRPLTTVNSQADEYSPMPVASGSLYFASARGAGAGDIWRSEFVDGRYLPPQKVTAFNGSSGEWNIWVDPEESMAIVEASGRPGAKSAAGDLYLYCRDLSGWQSARPLDRLNTSGSDLMARRSPDGRRFYFTSTQLAEGRDADIFAVPSSEMSCEKVQSSKRDYLFVVSRSAHEVVVVDTATMTVVRRLAAGTGGHEVALSPDRNHAYVPAYGIFPEPHDRPKSGAVSFVTVQSNLLVRLSVGGGNGRTDVEICPQSHGVLVTGEGHVWVTCELSGEVLQLRGGDLDVVRRWKLDQLGTHQLAATSDGRIIAASNTQSASVSLILPLEKRAITLPTGAGAEGLAVSPDDSEIWIGNAQAGTVSVVDSAERRVVATFGSGGSFPVKLAFARNGAEVWVVNTFSRNIAIFDTASRQLLETLRFETPPLGILVPGSGDLAYVTFPRENAVRQFDVASRALVGEASGIMEADGLALGYVPTDS